MPGLEMRWCQMKNGPAEAPQKKITKSLLLQIARLCVTTTSAKDHLLTGSCVEVRNSCGL
jgi:hypothetical protein